MVRSFGGCLRPEVTGPTVADEDADVAMGLLAREEAGTLRCCVLCAVVALTLLLTVDSCNTTHYNTEYKVVQRRSKGAVGYSITTLLQVVNGVCLQRNLKNWLIFGKDMDKNK